MTEWKKTAVLVGVAGIALTAGAAEVTPAGAAIDLTVAATYPIVEPDWRELIARRVAEADRLGLFATKRRDATDALLRHRERPVTHALPAAQTMRSRTKELYAADALAALPEATRLALNALQRRYVLFDGDSLAQRRWAVRELMKKPSRAVVATGALVTPDALLRRLDGTRLADPTRGVRLWADQGGVLVRRFGIGALPALVEVTGGTVRVTEVPVPDDEGDEPWRQKE